jgi:hypothetical protein
MNNGMPDLGPRLHSAVNWITGLFMAGIMILYLGLIGLGQWQADEYADFAMFRSKGWRFFGERMSWSPRPVSELLLLIYGWIVNVSQRPLIAPFLAVLWAGFLVAGVLTFLQTRLQRSHEENWLALIATLALPALILASGGLTEMFYWPVGAVAYLPTLAASLLLFWQIVSGNLQTAHGRRLCLLALTVTALSSELGAMFVGSFTLVQIFELKIHRSRKDSGQQDRVGIAWFIVPGLLSFAVLLVLLLNRFHQVEPGFTVPNPALGRPLLSGVVAVRELAAELFGRFPGQRAIRIVPKLLAELLLGLGVGLCWSGSRCSKFDRRALGRLIAAFLLACWLSLTSSYLHFGTAGGQRHELLRHCWFLMTFAGMGALWAPRIARWLPRLHSMRQVVAPLALLASVASVWHVRDVLREYKAYPSIARTIHNNFRSGFDSRTDPMIYAVPAHRGVLAFAQIEPGVYSRNPSIASYPEYILRFFDKRTLIVRKQVVP